MQARGMPRVAGSARLSVPPLLGAGVLLGLLLSGQHARAGNVAGEVRWQGAVPAPVMLQVNKDTECCGTKPRPSQRLGIGSQNGVRNAVIWVEGVRGAPRPGPREITLRQERCTYLPHLQVAPVGSVLAITNDDPVLHNVHGYLSTGNDERTLFNLAQPRKGLTFKKELKQTGVIRLKCDAGHIWMSAYIIVVDHPFYDVSDERGRFRIDNLPPGRYKVRMWHEGWNLKKVEEKAGKATGYFWSDPVVTEKEVTVPEHGEARVEFTLSQR